MQWRLWFRHEVRISQISFARSCWLGHIICRKKGGVYLTCGIKQEMIRTNAFQMSEFIPILSQCSSQMFDKKSHRLFQKWIQKTSTSIAAGWFCILNVTAVVCAMCIKSRMQKVTFCQIDDCWTHRYTHFKNPGGRVWDVFPKKMW